MASFTTLSPPPFAFAIATDPSPQWAPLRFAPLPPKASISGKRNRSLSDIDGAEPTSPQTKKRRLRLDLLTSRLSRSRSYSFPGSAAVASRGAPPSTAPLATRLVLERRMGRSVLRKAAIVNWMRVRHSVGAGPGTVLGEIPPELLEHPDEVLLAPGGGDADNDAEWDAAAQYLDVPPTESPPSPPPGLSNYSALDLEENVFDEGSWSDAEATGSDVDMDRQRGRGHRRRGALVRGEVEMVAPEGMSTGLAGWKPGNGDGPYWGMLVEDENMNDMRPQLIRREAVLY